MKKSALTIIIISIILLIVSMTSCTGDDSVTTAADIEPQTDLERMLSCVPYSFLEEYDIWFSNPAALKALYGFEDMNSLDAMMALSAEARKAVLSELAAISYPRWNAYDAGMASVIGWDWLMTECAVFHETPPPKGFVVAEGSFDTSVIAEKLSGNGYQVTSYEGYSCYSLNDDMEINITSEVGQTFMAQLNRVAFADDRLVTAPATGILNGLLDTIGSNAVSLLDNPASAVLADALGNPLAAVVFMPDRVLLSESTESPFDIPAAPDWGMLHEYDMVGIGYRDDGEERYWDICLYYSDTADAEADADELAARLESYVFMSQYGDRDNVESFTFSDIWETDTPVVKEYGEGAVLTIANRYRPETSGNHGLFTVIIEMRDLLFLVQDPMPFLK